MLLETKDGIKCDRCQSEHRINFTYYNIDISKPPKEYSVQQLRNYPVIKSVDLCQSCIDEIILLIKKHSKYLQGVIVCDLCGKRIQPTDYYFAKVIKAEVDSTEQKIDEHYVELNLCSTTCGNITNG